MNGMSLKKVLMIAGFLAFVGVLRRARAEPTAEERFELTYFAVMAKGLAPSLVLEVSGKPWAPPLYR